MRKEVMTMKRFTTAMLAIASILCLCLSGCVGRVTAESLLDGVREKKGPYLSMTLNITIEGESEGYFSTFDIGADYESSDGIMHISDLRAGMTGDGMEFEMTGEMWSDDTYTYSDTTVFGQSTGWMRDDSDGSTASVSGIVDGLMGPGIEATLEPHNKGEDYVVTWNLGMSALGDAFGSLAGDTGLDTVDQDTKVYAEFDGKTRELKTIRTSLGSVEGNESVTGLDITVTFHEIGTNKSLEIPRAIVEKDYSDQDYGFEIDEGFTGNFG